jgi:hypothetical protein
MSLHARLVGLVSFTALSLALLSACAGSDTGARADDAPGGGASPPAGIPLADVPGTTATASGKTVEMGIGTYCWTQMCVDKIGPVSKGALDVSRGDLISVAIPQGAPPLREVHASAFAASSPTVSGGGEDVWSQPPTGGTDLSTATDATSVEVQVDLAPGKYVLSVGMFFERGDVAYGVVLNVR